MFSCEEKSATVFITADIKGEQVSQIQFLNPILDISENLIVDGPEPLRIDLGGKPSIVKVKAGRASQYIYTEPGNNINITRPENKREFTITTDYQTEQDLLNEFEKTIGAAMGKFGPYQIMTVGVDSFLQLVDEKYKKSSELLRLAGNNGKAKKEVISWLESRIEAGKLLDKVNYPGYHYYYVKKVADLGEDYFSFIKDFDFDKETAYLF